MPFILLTSRSVISFSYEILLLMTSIPVIFYDKTDSNIVASNNYTIIGIEILLEMSIRVIKSLLIMTTSVVTSIQVMTSVSVYISI
jgi:hypothetical protein